MHICEVKRDGQEHTRYMPIKRGLDGHGKKWKDDFFFYQRDSHEERRHAGGRSGGYTNLNYFS